MFWTHNKPTAPGFYAYRDTSKHDARIVEVRAGIATGQPELLFVRTKNIRFDSWRGVGMYTGEWSDGAYTLPEDAPVPVVDATSADTMGMRMVGPPKRGRGRPRKVEPSNGD